MLHHNAKSHVANMNFIDSILFWYAEQFNSFTVLWLIMSAIPIHWVSIPKENFWLENQHENQHEIQIWFCDMSKQLISSNFLIVILA